MNIEQVDIAVVGGGQAGLSVSYHLLKRGLSHIVLDANERTGDSWRKRWDSLRVFTPARYCGLDGMRYPASGGYFPSKDEIADFFEQYARRHELPIRHEAEVHSLTRDGNRFLLETSECRLAARSVVVAMEFQVPFIPPFADELKKEIAQIHSSEYQRPSQLPDDRVLVVGAGNSGVEIALDLSDTHDVWLSGEYPGVMPVDTDSFLGRNVFARLVVSGLFHWLFSLGNPIGRRVAPRAFEQRGTLVRSKPKDVEAAHVKHVGRVAGVAEGLPVLTDGTVVDAGGVVWATGFDPRIPWIDPELIGGGRPAHERGIVTDQPGLCFVGLEYLFAPSSAMLRGVGRDAAYVADHLKVRHQLLGRGGVHTTTKPR